MVPHYRGNRLRLAPKLGSPNQENVAEVRRWIRQQRGRTAIDLFCGAGGLSLGLMDAGFSVLVGADSDRWSVETHRANLGGLGYVGDLSRPTGFLRQLRDWGINTVDLIAGGVPCQPFSRAGQSKIRSLVEDGIRTETDPRADLWKSFVKVVTELRPRAVLVENVPDIANWNDGAVLMGLRESLRKLGFETHVAILNASDYGVPQHRQRFVLIGLQGASFRWPTRRRGRVTLSDAIGDLPFAGVAQREESLAYDGPITQFQKRMRKGLRGRSRMEVFDHITRDVRPDDAKAFALLRQGGTYADLPHRLRRYRSDIFDDKYKRLEWDGLSRSITAHIAKDGYWYIHPRENRTLSIREAARIQTFPDSFRFAGEPSLRLRQIGNAVPPVLARVIGEELIRSLDSRRRRSQRSQRTFRKDLLTWHRKNARDFPWRTHGTSPWLILIAEMCLHRTRADQVAPVFAKLRKLARSPGETLSNEREIRAAMASLGLRWRVDNVFAAADMLLERFGGRVPNDLLCLRTLPGVGDYVANAVITFGFLRPAVILDTNTERIVSRVMGRENPKRWELRTDLYELSGKPGPDAAFNYALLDLGASVCRASSPLCGSCPVCHLCLSADRRR